MSTLLRFSQEGEGNEALVSCSQHFSLLPYHSAKDLKMFLTKFTYLASIEFKLSRVSLTYCPTASMQTQDGAIPGLMDIVSSEGFSAEAKEEAEGILEELSSRRSDSRLPVNY